MINRIVDVDAPGNGRRRAVPPSSPRFTAAVNETTFGTRVEEFLGEHPVLSIAIGFTVGMVVGCLVKRR